MQQPSSSTGSRAAGVFLAISTMAGAFIGNALGQPSVGVVVGVAIGVAICLGLWLNDRRRR